MARSVVRAAWRLCVQGSVSPRTLVLAFLLLLILWFYIGDVSVEIRTYPDSRSSHLRHRRPGLGRSGPIKGSHLDEVKVTVDETMQWQITDRGDLLYLYNAYFDDVERPEIRVVAMGNEKHIRRGQQVFCHFWNHSSESPTNVTGYLEHVRDAHRRSHVAMFAHCPIKDRERPTEVSVTFTNTTAIYNKLPIRYPRMRSPKAEFTVCYCVLHSNFSRYEALIQSLELDQLLGASGAVVYLHGDFPALAPVLRHYQAQGFLQLVQWRVPDTRHIHYFAQITAMNDCLYRNLHQSQYLIYHDMDEVLLPRLHHSWSDLMANLTSAFPNGAAFGFRCSYINEILPETPEHLPNDFMVPAKRLGLNFLLRTRRENFVYEPKWRSKLVIIPEKVATTGIHCIWRARKDFREYFMDPALGLNYHFRAKWVLNDTLTDTSVIDRFAGRLVTRVLEVLDQIQDE